MGRSILLGRLVVGTMNFKDASPLRAKVENRGERMEWGEATEVNNAYRVRRA